MYRTICLIYLWAAIAPQVVAQENSTGERGPLPWIRVSEDGKHFIQSGKQEPFRLWGANYDHDREGRLIEDYWHDQWQTVVDDFGEIKQLGANVVRIHLQLSQFMTSPQQANRRNLDRLAELVALAERTGLYLDLTGLGCYHKQDVPEWYDQLAEAERWDVQAAFWQAVAEVCKGSSAVFCYDLMNEPILAGNEPEPQWLTGELGGKHFVQRITLDLAGRSRKEVARQWVSQLTGAIREIDDRHLITVGVIPWAHTFKNAKPLFYSPEVGGPLDFVSVHFYPKKGDVAGSLAALKVYEIGKPLVVEEIFPLAASLEETAAFIDQAKPFVDGWISFYWGATIAENELSGSLKGALVAEWLKWFSTHKAVSSP